MESNKTHAAWRIRKPRPHLHAASVQVYGILAYLTASVDSVKSQNLISLTGTEQVLNEIDWQLSDPRIVTASWGNL